MNSKHKVRKPILRLMLVLSSLVMMITLSVNAEVNNGKSIRSFKVAENNATAKGQSIDKARSSSSQKFLLDLSKPSSTESILFKDFNTTQASGGKGDLAPIIDILCFVGCKAVGGSTSECIQFCTGYPTPH